MPNVTTATTRPGRSSPDWLGAVDVVLFDLDGTLHDDPRALDHHASALEVNISDGGGSGLRAEVVGDNRWNDVLPPAEQGCRTVHIDPLGTDRAGRWSSARYRDLASFAAALETDAT